MKNPFLFAPRHATTSALGFLLAFASLPASAASATWNGTTDAIWASGTNWSATPVPGTGDTATFDNVGGTIDVIDLGAGVTISSLLFNTSNVAAYTIGSGGIGSQILTLESGGNITLNNTIANNQLIHANVVLGGNYTITNNDTAETLTIAGGISGAGANLTKTGVGTLILSGLSTTAANNYTGTTILGGGTTTLTQNASFSGGLTFGSAASSGTMSTLNLNNASATFAGPMSLRTSSSSGAGNMITIGSGQKLTNNGNVTFSELGDRVRATVSGAGTWEIISSNGTFGGVSTTNGNEMVVDMSGLANFNANLRTGGSGSDGGIFRIGGLGGSTNVRANIVSLATNSTISADSVIFGGAAQTSSHTLSLGNGTQVINSDDIRMSTGTRDTASTINFRTTDGSLKIRGTDGGNSIRSNLSMLSGVTTNSTVTSTFDVTGHDADLFFNNVNIYSHTLSTGGAGTNYTATFSFDRGILDATYFNIGTKSAGNLNNMGAGVAHIGSSGNLTNSATLGNVTMGVLSTAGTVAVGTGLNCSLNITGSATAVNFSTVSMANYTAATNATVTSEVNISGGSTSGTGGIDMATAANGTVASTLNITGGSLSVGTSGVSATNGIFRSTTSLNATTTLVLNGGSLNLNGNSIGAAGANAITTRFESGTLGNVGEINGGGVLTKTTAGTLILTGTNTYTGATNVNVGTLLVNGSISNSSLTTVASGATIGGSGTVGALTVSSGGFINPGNSPDVLNVVGAYTQAGTYNAEITANTVGDGITGYDQINVTGTVNITDGSLAAMFTAGTYANGDLIFILLNDEDDAITGTYEGFGQGATVVNYGGFDWSISYTADSTGSGSFTGGNDIALMAIPEPKTALLCTIGLLVLLKRRRD
ncbi:MAG: autotransporter-associated beta strand repeat-containing protein [Verrucomicrobiota bacterium]